MANTINIVLSNIKGKMYKKKRKFYKKYFKYIENVCGMHNI